MKLNFQKLILSALFLGMCLTGRTAEISRQEVFDAGLKVLVIETVDHEEPTCESIKAPTGSWGMGITNVNKVPGSVVVYDAQGNELYNSGEYEKKVSGMTVKVRGNTSARFPKKPLKIKLEKKADLLIRGDKTFNDKNWVLLCDYNMLLTLGFLMGDWVGMPWTLEWEYVNVIFNGEYRGLYLLAESVERNETCRIQTEETGFITEHDPYWWNENGEYLSSKWNPEFNWTMKYPDFEDLTPEQKEYIQSVLTAFETMTGTEDYEEAIDIDSFARWLIAHDIMGTGDGGGTNLYLAKNDDTSASKLYIPVIWDSDSAEETPEAWSAVHSLKIIRSLFENKNTALVRRYVNLYYDIADDVFNRMDDFIAQLDTDSWESFRKSAALNNTIWDEAHGRVDDTDKDREGLSEWFTERKPWLDKAVAELDIATSIASPIVDTDSLLETRIQDGVLKVKANDVYTVYTADGTILYSGKDGEMALPSRGVYIIKSAGKSVKLAY